MAKKRRAGRKSKLTEESQAAICHVVAFGGTDEAAARAGGISQTTLQRWLQRADGKAKADAPYRTFRAKLQRARAIRPDAILARLPEYQDYHADVAYLKQLRARERRTEARVRTELRKLDAEARIVEAKAAAIERIADAAGAGGMLLLPGDFLEDVSPELLGELKRLAASQGVALLEATDLGAGVSAEDVERFSPSEATTATGDDDDSE